MAEKKLGEYLKARRLEKGLTLQQLSYASGVDVTYLGRIERGERRPSAAKLRLLSEPLGVPELELLKVAGYLSRDSVDDRIERFKASLRAEIHSTMNDLLERVDSL